MLAHITDCVVQRITVIEKREAKCTAGHRVVELKSLFMNRAPFAILTS
jgi:hypothetical protein